MGPCTVAPASRQTKRLGERRLRVRSTCIARDHEGFAQKVNLRAGGDQRQQALRCPAMSHGGKNMLYNLTVGQGQHRHGTSSCLTHKSAAVKAPEGACLGLLCSAVLCALRGDADVVEDAHAVHGVDVRLRCAVVEHLQQPSPELPKQTALGRTQRMLQRRAQGLYRGAYAQAENAGLGTGQVAISGLSMMKSRILHEAVHISSL